MEAQVQKAPSKRKLSVLLVEDNLDDVLITKRAWKKGRINSELHVAYDGEEALDFLNKRGKYSEAPNVSLVLLDLKMPRMNGLEVLQNIKSDKVLKKIPIVMLTTSNRNEDIEKAYEYGCNGYIVKPVSYDNFIKAVHKIEDFWLELSVSPFGY